METVKLLDYTEKPLYQNLRDILLQGLKAIGSKDDGKLDFSAVENGSVNTKPASKVGLGVEGRTLLWVSLTPPNRQYT